MRRAIYVGPVVELRGEGAIVRPAYRSGGFPAIVSHGWHEFPAQDFQLCDS